MKTKQKGFTMIELIVVIAIIGILAAIAIPRFINQTSNARIAALNGLGGAINSSVALAQTQYRGDGNSSTSTTSSVTMNGQAVTVIAGSGRPAATSAGINAALETIAGFAGTYASGVATYNFSTSVTDCNLTYTDTTGAVAYTTSGC